MKNVEKVGGTGIFTRFIYKALPLAFDESLSYYECLCALLDYLQNTVIPALNNNAEAIVELQELYTELKEYVDNYFENLDIQEEINNKLDKMAESGQLADIIAQYLEVASVLGFNTKADLKAGETFANKSIARTIGTDTYNDGKGNYYKIRTITSSDVIDDENILALTNYPTLIAEKLPDYRMNQAENSINNINNSLDEINDIFNNFNNVKTIIIGDSYLNGYVEGGDSITGFGSYLKQKLGVSDSNWLELKENATGFNTTKTWLSMLQEIEPSNDVKRIIVVGGFNDRNYTTGLDTAINNFISYCNTNFPNAKIMIGFIGWAGGYGNTANGYRLNSRTALSIYKNCANNGKNSIYLNGVENAMHIYDNFQSDGIHPNAEGQQFIANAIAQSINIGYFDLVTSHHGGQVGDNANLLYDEYIDKNNIILLINGYIDYNAQNIAQEFNLGTIDTYKYIRTSVQPSQIFAKCVLTLSNSSTLYKNVILEITNTSQVRIWFPEFSVVNINKLAISNAKFILPILEH